VPNQKTAIGRLQQGLKMKVNFFKTALFTITLTIPVGASAQLYCKPPTQLICWGSYRCWCDSPPEEIELQGQRVMLFKDFSELKPVNIDGELKEALQSKMRLKK
jgi:hypothetical protein